MLNIFREEYDLSSSTLSLGGGLSLATGVLSSFLIIKNHLTTSGVFNKIADKVG